jgi:hypothetical protein
MNMGPEETVIAILWGAVVRSGDTGHGQVWDGDGDGTERLLGTISPLAVRALKRLPQIEEVTVGQPGTERKLLRKRRH